MDLLPYMEQWNMLPEAGGVILCAVSGGRDSMCLLHYLHQLGKEQNFTVAAAHLNHLMRPTAERDVSFVRMFCAENSIPFYTEAVPVYDRKKEWNVTVEEAGRRARYEFLERTAAAVGASRIATAHHRRDQAETVLLNLLRGTGPEGLSGIPPVRGRYIRPLLNTSRNEIETYLIEHRIGYVEDETNQSRDYARNRLRLDIWPLLETLHGGAEENVVRCAEIIRRENDCLEELAARYLPETGTEISCAALAEAPPALQSRVLRQMISRLPAGKKDIGAVHIEGLKSLSAGRGTLTLPGGITAQCDGRKLRLFMAESPPPQMLLHQGENRWGDYLLTVVNSGASAVSVRSWQTDDRLILPGSRGARSLKRLFTERGISPPEREVLPVICVDEEVAAVYAVGENTGLLEKKAVKITIKKLQEEKN